MAVNSSFGLFGIIPEAANNENTRPGIMLLEYFDVIATIGTLEETLELPTQLDEVLGLIDLKFKTTGGDPTDTIQLHTDGVITSGAVTIDVLCLDVADGAIHVRGFLVGRKRDTTALINTPSD